MLIHCWASVGDIGRYSIEAEDIVRVTRNPRSSSSSRVCRYGQLFGAPLLVRGVVVDLRKRVRILRLFAFGVVEVEVPAAACVPA